MMVVVRSEVEDSEDSIIAVLMTGSGVSRNVENQVEPLVSDHKRSVATTVRTA